MCKEEQAQETPVQPAAPRVSAEAAQAWLKRTIEPQRAWYDAKAQTAKRWHVATSGVQLVGTAAIPVVNTITHSVAISSVLAGAAAIATGFGQLLRHHDHWLTYRAAAAALDNLQKRYEVGLPPFDGADRHDLLIVEADRITGDESGKWLENVREKAGVTGSGAPRPNIDDN